MNIIQEAKQAARAFLQSAYSDEKLTQGLDHLRSGTFSFTSCCCFIGMVTADHGLCGRTTLWGGHYWKAYALPGGPAAEQAAGRLGRLSLRGGVVDDAKLTRRLIPIFLAEIRRREKVRNGRVETPAIVESETSPVL